MICVECKVLKAQYILINGEEKSFLCDIDLKDALLDLVLHNDFTQFESRGDYAPNMAAIIVVT